MISVKPPPNMSTAHNCRKRKLAEVNETKDGELNGKPKRTGCVAQETDTGQTPESSQLTTKQESGALVSTEEYAAALERIKHLEELNEKLCKEIQESHVNNQQSVKLEAESGQTSRKEVVIPLRKQRGRMSKEDRMKIISKMPFLIEQLNPEHLISTMFSKFLICEDEADELRTTFSTKGRKICAENMLYMLIRCGPYAYKIFLKCLELTGYSKVIEELEPNCEIYEGNIKYPGHQYYELIDNKNPKREEFIKKAEVNLEDIYESTELVVIRKLTKGCVQVTFHLISLGSKNEHELREVLESKVNTGYIGDSKVSTEGFSFKKIERGLGEERDTDRNGEDQNSQLVSQENFNKLKRKIEELQGFNSRLLMHIAELETELEEDQKIVTDRTIDLENDTRTLKLQINELQRKNAELEEMEKYKEHEAKIYKEKIQEQEVIISSLQKQLDEQPTDSGIRKYLTMPIAGHRDRDPTPLPIPDKQDKDKMEKEEGGSQSPPTRLWTGSSFRYQRKIRQILGYLVTHHPDKVRPLVELLKDKDVIDAGDSKQIVMSVDKGSIDEATLILSKSLTSNSHPCFIESVKELGLSDVEDMIGKGGNLSPARISHQLTSASSSSPNLTGSTVEYRGKIKQIIDYLVTHHPDKVRPLVELLKDKGVLDDDDSEVIIMYKDRDDIKMATHILSNRLTYTYGQDFHGVFMQCVKELGLSEMS